MSIFSRVNSPEKTKLATVTLATAATEKADFSPIVAKVATVSVATIQSKVLRQSSSGNDIPPANQVPVNCWTQSGELVTAYSECEQHAKWIKAYNPQPTIAPSSAYRGIPEVSNPGLPSDLFILAIRYCAESHGDGDQAVLTMLDDLMTVPDDWWWWVRYLTEKLAIPDQVRCIDCQHCSDTGGNLGRCLRGVQAPGASSLWWVTESHPCLMYQAQAIPTDPDARRYESTNEGANHD